MKVFRSDKDGAASILGSLEARILEVLWGAEEPLPVASVAAKLNVHGPAISYSATKAVLNNLTAKELARKSADGRRTLFQATLDKTQFQKLASRQVIEGLKRNFGAPAIAQFIDTFGGSDEELDQLEALIARRRENLKP